MPATAKLLQAREQLANLLRYMDGKAAAEDTLEEAAGGPGADGGDEGEARARSRPTKTARNEAEKWGRNMAVARGTAVDTAPVPALAEADDFAALLKQNFKPRSERAASEVENAVQTLVTQALADSTLVKTEVLDTIEEMIAAHRRKTYGADERDPARAGVPAARKRLARPELSGVQLGDRRDAEDPRA